MAEYSKPFRSLGSIVPTSIQNPVNTSLLANLFDKSLTHEDAVKLYGLIGRYFPNSKETRPWLVSRNIERAFNQLIPMITTKVGTEEYFLSFADMMNKADASGIDTSRMNEWMVSKSFNFAPPIDIDKFTNFSSYYWVQSALTNEVLSWNPEQKPEYYVIEKPSLMDKQKLPVHVASTSAIENLNGTLQQNQTWTISFTSASTFSLVGSIDVVPELITMSGHTYVYSGSKPLAFTLEKGTEDFVNGDQFVINVEHLSNLPAQISFTGTGSGVITGMRGTLPFGTIDSIQLVEGMRVLVKNQVNPSENGLYLVSATQWVRTFDTSTSSMTIDGIEVYVKYGTQNGGKVFESLNSITFAHNALLSPMSDWQSGNYWVHAQDLYLYGLTTGHQVQRALRPIIEYDKTLELSTPVQYKSRFNQPPLFNLYWPLDGTLAPWKSSIFYYVEDPSEEFDVQLQRRVKANKTGNFYFAQGCKTPTDGRVLSFKQDGVIRSIWKSTDGFDISHNAIIDRSGTGNLSQVVVNPLLPSLGRETWTLTPQSDGITFTVVGSKSGVQTPDAIANGSLYQSSSGAIQFFLQPKANGSYSGSDQFIIISGIEASSYTNNETWTLTCKNSTTFEVRGSKAGQLPDAVVGTTYVSDFIAFEFDAPFGTTFGINGLSTDNIRFEVANSVERPRYAVSGSDNLPKTSINVNDPLVPGCWLTPPQMMMNLELENRTELLFGDLASHFTDIIQSQPSFVGSSFGSNNFRKLNSDCGYGGKIKTLNGSTNLFFSMLNQHDLTPVSLLDFAELQYGIALNSIQEYITTLLPITLGSIADASIPTLFSQYEQNYSLRAGDEVSGVFRNTTSPIKGWPITLPLMGMILPVQPLEVYDFELDAQVIVHHDGHQTPIFTVDAVFEHNISLVEVLRYDGTSTPGVSSSIEPIRPYRGQLWYDTSNRTLKYFSVDFEGHTSAPDLTGIVSPNGKLWYNRVANELRMYNASTLTWDVISLSLNWVSISVQTIVNDLVLYAEQKLYDEAVSSTSIRWDVTDPVYQNAFNLQYELAKFAIKNSFDPLGSNYNINDPFTWNYHLTDFSSVGLTSHYARWHKLYAAYFNHHIGIVNFTRPDMTPWKFFGYDTYADAVIGQPGSTPGSWLYDSDYPLSLLSTSPTQFRGNVTYVDTSNNSLSNMVIDGYTIIANETVLLTAQTNPIENGLYVSNGTALVRVLSYSSAALNDTFVIEKGSYADTFWIVTTAPNTIGVDPFELNQVRSWKPDLWSDIHTLHPGLKLCVNVRTDQLIPPYVHPSLPFSGEALTTVEPPLGLKDSYAFGDEGPVELIWRHSIAFAYSQARSSYKIDPINFLATNWGFQTFATPNGLTLDRMTGGQLMTHHNFSLHGETIRTGFTFETEPSFEMTNIVTAGVQMLTLEVVFQLFTGQFILRAVEDSSIVLISSTGSFSKVGLGSFTYNLNEHGYPLVIGDKFTIIFSPLVSSSSFTPATKATYKGLNQLYTQFLAYNSMDAVMSSNVKLLREWKTQLGYRTGTLIEDGNLEIQNDIYGTITPSAYRLFLNKANIAKNLWLHALRVQVLEMGSSSFDRQVIGQDADGNMIYVPKNQGENWTFRIENYFPRHPQVDTYVLDTSSNGDFETFNAFSKEHSTDEWRNYLDITAIQTVNLPVTIKGIQNVVNFLHAYGMYIHDQGFLFGQGDNPSQDPVTGRIENWQFEVERFIDNLYKGTIPGRGFSVNPFMKKFWIATPTGLPASFVQRRFDDILTSQYIFDVTGDIVIPSGSTVIRFDDHTEIQGDVPMFGCHLTIDEYEHLIVFENYLETSPFNEGLFFDPFLNLSIERLLLDGRARRNHTFRPTFGGFFLNDQNNFKKNIAASVDDMGDYYNADKVYDNDDTTKHALSLLGFSKKGYFDLLKTSEKSEFNFWRAMINAKGTQYSIDAFLNSAKFEHAKVDEFWAYKIAEYGDARVPTYPEIKLNANDCVLKHTRLFFEDGLSATPQAPSTYISILPTDENRWFTLSDLNTTLKFEPDTSKTYSFEVSEVGTKVSLPKADAYEVISTPTLTAQVTFHTQTVVSCDTVGTYTLQLIVPAKPKFSPIKLFDYVDKALIEDITTWHPAFDNHTAIAMEIINVVSTKDPAFYNYSTLTAKNPSYDPQKAWGDREVGRTWWDQTLLEYVPYYDKTIFPTFEERLGRWGSMSEYSSINVYEWVKSNLPPTEYDAQAQIDQLSADVMPEDKKTGKAARKQSYKRTRTWEARPIAWSYVPTPPEAQDVQLFSSGTTRLTLSSPGVGDAYVHLERGRFSNYGITPGMHFSGYLGNKPYGEAVFTGPVRFTISNGYNSGDMMVVSGDGTFFDLIQFVWSDNKNYIGASIGHIEFEWVQIGSDYFMRGTEVASGISVIQPLLAFAGQPGNAYEVDFVQLGIKMRAISAVASMSASDVSSALEQVLSPDVGGLFNLEIKEYMPVSVLIPFPTDVLDNVLPITLPVSYDNELTVEGINAFSNVTFVKHSGASTGSYSISGELNTLDDTYYLYLYKDGALLDSLAIDTLTSTALAIQPLTETFTFTFPGVGANHISVTVEVHPDYLQSGVDASDVILELQHIGSTIIVGYNTTTGEITLSSSVEDVIEQFGWIAYNVPTQEELTSDLQYPTHSSWMPVFGDYVSVPSVRQVIDEIVAYEKEPLMLNDGSLVDKFNPIWGDWILLEQEVVRKYGQGSTLDLTFTTNKVSDKSLRVYLNGISQSSINFYKVDTLSGLVSTLVPVQPGHEVVGILAPYEPSSTELSFDPDVSDDPSIQTQYKSDYQYVIRPTRDSAGNITGSAYYFWVKDKTVPFGNKELTVQQSAQLLREGPSTYLTFQELSDNAYHGVTIAGLNLLINKDNTYKLRFTRDFSLRDNPQDLDLKNVHTEWTLIRPQQFEKIPLTLWNKLVDSACGQNAIGQSLPALSKVLYDERHGTRTRYGFREDQVLADRSLVTASLTNSILNPKTTVYLNGINTTATIVGLDLSQSSTWFTTASSTRQTLDYIWRYALPQHINELFFEVINDALANNYEFTDLFKTSRLSVHSIITITPEPIINNADVYF